MADHAHPALALTAIEVSDVRPDPEQLNRAVVRYLRHMDFPTAADHVEALAAHGQERVLCTGQEDDRG